MPNKKISELPTYTGDTTGTYVVIDNSSLTETFKIQKESFVSGYLEAPVRGTWTLATGANTVSFTVPASASYIMSVMSSVPNGIVVWVAQVTVTNTNVPVVGVSYAWYYNGNGLVFTAIPGQIVGVLNAITSSSPSQTNSNIFTFGITNNTGSSQVVNYSYLKTS